MIPLEAERERALLIGVQVKRARPLLSIEESLDELALLADTAGAQVVGRLIQRLDRIAPSTYIGSGKVDQAVALIEELDADVVIFDDELSPRHQRVLEDAFGEQVRLLDRTALILDIFAQHALTREGQLQVELAQLEYRLPRLTRMWTHLARQAGGRAGGGQGSVGLRGPGETQLEVDQRIIGQRIGHLKGEIEKIRAHRSRHRLRRRRNDIPVVAIVGYTNAGKSTLLNRLSGANILVADMLFATLDPTTRRVQLPGGNQALMTDTVGFIQKLPTTLVAAFRATLEEITEADLLVHVVDATHPQAAAQAEAVLETLGELEVDSLPIITALNKIDRLDGHDHLQTLLSGFETAVPISALTGAGVISLQEKVERLLLEEWIPIDIIIPYDQGALVSLFHEQGRVELERHLADGVHLVGVVPRRVAYHFRNLATE